MSVGWRYAIGWIAPPDTRRKLCNYVSDLLEEKHTHTHKHPVHTTNLYRQRKNIFLQNKVFIVIKPQEIPQIFSIFTAVFGSDGDGGDAAGGSRSRGRGGA